MVQAAVGMPAAAVLLWCCRSDRGRVLTDCFKLDKEVMVRAIEGIAGGVLLLCYRSDRGKVLTDQAIVGMPAADVLL